LSEALERDGYFVIYLSSGSRAAVQEAVATLKACVGDLASYVGGSDHESLADAVSGLARDVVRGELEKVKGLIGDDVLLQAKPYLRVARPGIESDNIGLHRDTWYGARREELSISIALTDQDESSALRIAPGSHRDEDEELETVPSEIEKGSVKHRMGFPYAPKRLKIEKDTIPVPLKVGQALVFSIAALHGQVVNASQGTRFTVDARIAPASICGREHTAGEYYERLK
jgi:hypothetical protein